MKGKILVLGLLFIVLTGCCQHPDICHPPSRGNQYSMMGFIMGGGLIGHVLREGKKNQPYSYKISKEKKKQIDHFNRYHNELNM